MTKLGKLLEKKAISKSAVSEKTGISRSRLSELANNPKTHLRAKELYLIALAIDVNPSELLHTIYKDLSLQK